MIWGIGCDIVDIRRIEKIIQRRKNFIEKIFTLNERFKEKYSGKHHHEMGFYAKRFAAKEAFYKATGGGVCLEWKSVEILSDDNRKPFFSFSSSALELLENHFSGKFQSFLSLSDEYPYAKAFVVIQLKKF